MKRRVFASVLVGLLGVVSASACDSTDYGDNSYGGGGLGHYCREYTSCGTCTPVMGCGWCQTGVGKGQCADDPNDCAGAPAFSWTWNPSGCFASIADAAVSTPADAGSATVADSSATVDAAPPDAAPLPDSAALH